MVNIVISKDGKEKGTVKGSRPCQLEGCGGRCYRVTWADGKHTWPCTHGMKFVKTGTMRIL